MKILFQYHFSTQFLLPKSEWSGRRCFEKDGWKEEEDRIAFLQKEITIKYNEK